MFYSQPQKEPSKKGFNPQNPNCPGVDQQHVVISEHGRKEVQYHCSACDQHHTLEYILEAAQDYLKLQKLWSVEVSPTYYEENIRMKRIYIPGTDNYEFIDVLAYLHPSVARSALAAYERGINEEDKHRKMANELVDHQTRGWRLYDCSGKEVPYTYEMIEKFSSDFIEMVYSEIMKSGEEFEVFVNEGVKISKSGEMVYKSDWNPFQ